MNEAFWAGFEKEASLLNAAGHLAGRVTGGVQRAGSAIRNAATSGSEGLHRAAIQARQRASIGYRTGQRKALGMNPAQYGEMRRGVSAATSTATKAAPAATAAAAPAKGFFGKAHDAMAAHPVATAAGAAGLAAGGTYLAMQKAKEREQGVAV